jgi:hypothetical protein
VGPPSQPIDAVAVELNPLEYDGVALRDLFVVFHRGLATK